MAKKLKAAIIGCGNIAGVHGHGYKDISDRVSIAYCVDIVPERAKKRAEEHGDENTICTADYKDVLKDTGVDLVSICLPNHLHAPISIAFLEAGKHVLCEKPAALDYAQTLEMKNAADKYGKILNIGVCNRFNASVERVKAEIGAGELGELYQIYCSFRAYRSIPALGDWFTTRELSGGGALIDWGVHFIDLIWYCIGEIKPKTVSAVCHSKLAVNMKDYVYRQMHGGSPDYSGTYDVEEFVTGLIRTSGPALTFCGAWAQNIDEDAMFVEFMGTKGGIKLDYGGHYTYYGSEDGELITRRPEFEIPNAYSSEISAFVDSAVKGEKIRSNIDQILITSQIMDAIYESDARGEEIKI